MIDYQKLLKWYLRHVYMTEGAHFLWRVESVAAGLSDEEGAEMARLRDEMLDEQER